MPDDARGTVRLHAREGPASCSYCRGTCDDGTTILCESCGASYHGDCLEELGHCATLGCAQPRAAAVRPSIVIRPLCCCRRRAQASASDPVVVCDACGARWHAACLTRSAGGGECCAGHGVTPEARLRPRETGPRVGTERPCTSCLATFRVEAASRYSPYCPPCRRQANLRGGVLIVILLLAQVLFALLPELLRLIRKL